jgi:regulator of RNase E activity RraA
VVLGDDCGVVAVPGELFSQAMSQALQIKKDEEKIIKKMETGYSLTSIIK